MGKKFAKLYLELMVACKFDEDVVLKYLCEIGDWEKFVVYKNGKYILSKAGDAAVEKIVL